VAYSDSEQEVKYPYVWLKKSSLDFFLFKSGIRAADTQILSL
jgi:hypothetical protein